MGAMTISRLSVCDDGEEAWLRMRDRRRQRPKQVHAGSQNAHQGGRSDRACVALPASPLSAADGNTGRPTAAVEGWCRGVQHMHDPNGLHYAHSSSPRAPD